eukprot:TRINITY_DN8517_c0_g1_i1.p1 TRINITY_DN8517_c0_g1~~TRINITY_DN8517_c0_g1_i1.p1  ORF type:complete len:653 (-),score=115.71 TRINITY_DN8517_c0_g1_i1:40-1956(-)
MHHNDPRKSLGKNQDISEQLSFRSSYGRALRASTPATPASPLLRASARATAASRASVRSVSARQSVRQYPAPPAALRASIRTTTTAYSKNTVRSSVMEGNLAAESEPPEVRDELEDVVYPWFHPVERPYIRAFVLLLSCLINIGPYFTFDSLGIVQLDVQREYDISSVTFGLLFSVYSFPNIVLPFASGVILDRYGIRRCALGASIIALIGAVLVALSSRALSFPLMMIGRMVYGIGAEMTYVATDIICCAWFKHHGMAFALGTEIAAGRLASYMCFSLNAWVVQQFDYTASMWSAVIMCLLSLVFCLIYVFVDWKSEQVMNEPIVESGDDTLETLRAVQTFPVQFWLVCLTAMVYFSAIFPFQSTGTAMLVQRYDYSESSAQQLMSLLPLTSMFISPLLGIVVDQLGRKGTFIIVGLGIMFGAFAIMVTAPDLLLVTILVLGVVYSLLPAAVWPCVPCIVPSSSYGVAYGLLGSAANVGLTVAYPLVGTFQEWDFLGLQEMLLYMTFVAIGVVSAVAFTVIDTRRGGIINARGTFDPHTCTSVFENCLWCCDAQPDPVEVLPQKVYVVADRSAHRTKALVKGVYTSPGTALERWDELSAMEAAEVEVYRTTLDNDCEDKPVDTVKLRQSFNRLNPVA